MKKNLTSSEKPPAELRLRPASHTRNIRKQRNIWKWVQRVFCRVPRQQELLIRIPSFSSQEALQAALANIRQWKSEGHQLRLDATSLKTLSSLISCCNCPNCQQVPIELQKQKELALKIVYEIFLSDTSEKSDEDKASQARLESSLANLIQGYEKVARF